MDKLIYVDHSATTYLKKEVLEEMLPYFIEKYGNSSSLYKLGGISKTAIENSRKTIASLIGSHSDEIYFTSGGTEADNLIIRGIAYANRHKGNHIITSKIEHLAVLNTCRNLEKEGFEVTYLDVEENGIINTQELARAIKPETILISIMLANNEIGTIQDISAISKIAKSHGIYLHTDAVQCIGSIPVNVKELEVDALSISAHKFYGPKGIGLAYIKRTVPFDAILLGGHQEKNKRAGTENVPAIVGMAKAMEIAYKEVEINSYKLVCLRNYMIDRILNEIPNTSLNGDRYARLPGNANICFKGIDGKALALMLDMNNIEVSTGSACTSSSNITSHVLKAIGLNDKDANSSVRFSLGEKNTAKEVDIIISVLKISISKLYSNY